MNKNLALTAMLGALGLVLPMIFHAIGLGSMFLPMFWPVVLGAFFLPLPFALLLGAGTPMLSGLLTGMPLLAPPIAHLMAVEFTALAGLIALFSRRFGWRAQPALLASLGGSRILYYGMVYSFAGWLGLPERLASLAMLTRTLPGLVLLLLLMPPLVVRLRRLFRPTAS